MPTKKTPRVYIKKARRATMAAAGLFAFAVISLYAYQISLGIGGWDALRSLANPNTRFVQIAEGMRKEEIADHIAKRLEWSTLEKREFINAHLDLDEENMEGKYFPGTYVLTKDAEPGDVALEMKEKYEAKIAEFAKKYPKSTINPDTALLIASIIQREAAGKGDMRLISGVIWNRMFRGMSLDMDATIQYARGKTEDGWWAPIKASDIRTIESPYNTYKNDGLPPTPISNPGAAAIDAALNPEKTSCLFYIHDRWKRIHCSATYVGHERNIETYLK